MRTPKQRRAQVVDEKLMCRTCAEANGGTLMDVKNAKMHMGTCPVCHNDRALIGVSSFKWSGEPPEKEKTWTQSTLL